MREVTREAPREETRAAAPASSTGSAAEPERAREPADSQRVRGTWHGVRTAITLGRNDDATIMPESGRLLVVMVRRRGDLLPLGVGQVSECTCEERLRKYPLPAL